MRSSTSGTLVFLLLAGACSHHNTALGGGSCPANSRASSNNPQVSLPLPAHPRILINSASVASAQNLVASDPQAQKLYQKLQASAAQMLAQPVSTYVANSAGGLGTISRTVLSRVVTLAGLYLIDGDPQKAARAEDEMLAVAAFPDWNPENFLATAEMTQAMAVGYDWLFPVMSPDDRNTVATAIAVLGLKAGLSAYAANAWWAKSSTNWASVCNGALANGALAIADEDPTDAAAVLDQVRTDIAYPLALYAPDGGWPEGPIYQGYGTKYVTYLLATLQTALGTDWGLSASPGLDQTGYDHLYTLGPNRLTFNFADADDKPYSDSWHMLWLARQFDNPVFTNSILAEWPGPDALALFWYSPSCVAPAGVSGLPLDRVFKGTNVAVFRGAWGDPDATFVGFKGGDNTANHAHLDLGSYVVDALGERWVLDLGADSYSLPGYSRIPQRWTYYRTRTEGHNTLAISATPQQPLHFANQVDTAQAPLLAFLSTPSRSFAVADLTQAYSGLVNQALRGVALLDRSRILVQDEVSVSGGPVEIISSLHTAAAIALQGGTARLTQNGRSIRAQILTPAQAFFEVVTADPTSVNPAEDPNTGVSNLILRISGAAGQVTIAVLLSPANDSSPPPTLSPLAQWVAESAAVTGPFP